MCILSDCVVRIETGVWVIRFHYVAYIRNVVRYLTIDVDHATTVHGRRGVACRGHWSLGAAGH